MLNQHTKQQLCFPSTSFSTKWKQTNEIQKYEVWKYWTNLLSHVFHLPGNKCQRAVKLQYNFSSLLWVPQGRHILEQVSFTLWKDLVNKFLSLYVFKKSWQDISIFRKGQVICQMFANLSYSLCLHRHETTWT